MGNLSFTTNTAYDTYSDHAGQTATHDTHPDVTIHRFTGVANHWNRAGMDLTITKLSEAGVPSSHIFAADLVPHEGSDRTYGWMSAVAGFAGVADHIAADGNHVGDLHVPTTASSVTFLNTKFDGWNYSAFVAKVDMSTGKAAWATNTALQSDAGRFYARDVATTASGHVIVTGDARTERSYTGMMAKYDGTTGADLWVEIFDELSMKSIEIVDEIAYVSGTFKGAAVTKYGGSLTSCESGKGNSAFAASFDVSGAAGPVAKWMKLIGCGKGVVVKVLGDFLYLGGELEDVSGVASDVSLFTLTPATGVVAATCILTSGDMEGYLAKLNKNGGCLWAKSTAKQSALATDGTHVWTAVDEDEAMKFSTTLTMSPGADDDQIFGAKYDATDGAGLWVDRFGGTGDSRVSDMIITPTGPVVIGYTQSELVAVGDVTAKNLQHAKAKAGMTAAEAAASPQAGAQALLLVKLSLTDKAPSCITSCPSGTIDTNTVVASGFRYANNVCLANGDFSPRRRAASQFLPFASKASLKAAVQMWVTDQPRALNEYGPISGWGVSAITNLMELFKDLQTFDEDISSWDTSSVTDMRYMFRVRPLRMPCPQCPVGSSVHVACTVTTPTRPRASRPARRRP